MATPAIRLLLPILVREGRLKGATLEIEGQHIGSGERPWGRFVKNSS
jgi:hypothetical protein